MLLIGLSLLNVVHKNYLIKVIWYNAIKDILIYIGGYKNATMDCKYGLKVFSCMMCFN